MKVKESVPLLMSNSGELVAADEKKVEILNTIFVFATSSSPHGSHFDGPQAGDQKAKSLPL